MEKLRLISEKNKAFNEHLDETRHRRQSYEQEKEIKNQSAIHKQIYLLTNSTLKEDTNNLQKSTAL